MLRNCLDVCRVYTRICRTTDDAWQARFQEAIRAFQAAQADARQREDALAGVDAYMAWRRQASGLLMGLALIEYAEGLNIPDTARTSEPLKRLADNVLDIVIWMHVSVMNLRMTCELTYTRMLHRTTYSKRLMTSTTALR